MISMKQVMAISRAETLITRRLARYWVFLSLSYLAALFIYFLYSAMHYFSSYSATAGAVSPRFLLSVIGLFYSIIFIVGTIFLAFDIRARDKRERMIEVLDSRPYSNLELVTGRFLGIFIPAWIPIVVLVVLLEIMGFTLKGIGFPIGEPIEIFSLISFVFLMAIPTLSFAIALVFFVTLLARNRIVAAVILLVLLIGLYYWSMGWLPSIYGDLFDISGFGATFFTSEIVPRLATPEGWVQRFSVLFAAFSLLGFSAAVHPRFDGGSRLKLTVGSIIIMIFAFSLTGALYYQKVGDIRTMETWKEAHAALSDEIVPDLKNITGNIEITPGKDLLLDLDITFGAPDKGPLQKALFTLNPGQEVKSVVDSSGKSMIFTHENGLLELRLPQTLGPGEETTVHLTVEGLPDDRFAFLYSAFDLVTSTGLELGDVPLLGVAPCIFEKDFVALMPGLRWLPVSGPEKDRDDPRIRTVDFFDVDLKVDLPKGWLAAGPGRRHKVEGNNNGVSFRFSPPAPLPELALIASRFETRAMEVEGVTLEVLIHKKHMKNLEVLAETGEKIQEWVGDCFREAKEFGLGYPYDALTLVEVPNYLRSYGGGWRMDTVMAPPGMLLMRETGFPTARFDSAFRNPEDFKGREGGIQQAKWERLQTFFKNDFLGGNVLTGASRNFFRYQTSATGPESLALNFVMETLSGLLLADTKGYFSAHMFTENQTDSVISNVLINYFQRRGIGETISSATISTRTTSRPVIWEKALEVSLKDMDLWKDPADSIDVLTLKGYAISDSIFNILGREKTASLLATICNNYRGKYFSIDDMIKVGKDLGYDIDELFGDWIGSTELPGFIVSEAKGYRIPDDDNGNPRYQLLFTVRNDEPVPGAFRFAYYYSGENQPSELTASESMRLEGRHSIQYGTVVSRPPNMFFLVPYLSLNRGVFNITMNPIDHDSFVKKDPIEGIKEIPWEIPASNSIVVDDLDEGFSILEEEKKKGLRIKSQKNGDMETDQGLPYISLNIVPYGFPLSGEWSRMTSTSTWGTYRHTTAVINSGKGSKKALFATSLPNDGTWDLEFHLPMKAIFPGKRWGTWHVIVRDSNGDQHEVRFDSEAGNEGWNLADKLNLPKGKVTIELSDKTDGNLIVADAIRWTPSAGN
jgi:ABC-type transport system involved in multi-copper enzyme maturation permease subunit